MQNIWKNVYNMATILNEIVYLKYLEECLGRKIDTLY